MWNAWMNYTILLIARISICNLFSKPKITMQPQYPQRCKDHENISCPSLGIRSQNQGIRHYQELPHNNHNSLLKTLSILLSRGQEQECVPTAFYVFRRAQERPAGHCCFSAKAGGTMMTTSLGLEESPASSAPLWSKGRQC